MIGLGGGHGSGTSTMRSLVAIGTTIARVAPYVVGPSGRVRPLGPFSGLSELHCDNMGSMGAIWIVSVLAPSSKARSP